MDIKHTKEPWNAIPANSAWHTGKDSMFQDGCWYILPREDYERTPIAMIDKTNDLHAPTRKQAEYDAKRIVACVNACVDIPNEELEEIAAEGGMLTPRQQIGDIAKERDTAWEELRKIREAIKANPEESTFDEVERVVSQGDILLEALKGLIEFAEPYFDKDGFGYIGKLEAAKKCIAKAEGRL